MKKKTAIIVIIASLVVIGGIIGAIIFLRNRSLGGYNKNLVYVESVRSVNGLPVGNASRFMGVVESQDSKAVNKDSDKNVKEVFVKVGETVKKGDKLFSYDTSDMEMNLEQLNIDRTGIQNTIDSLNTTLNDYSTQLKSATTDSEKNSLQSQINSTNSSIKEEQYNLEKKDLEIKKQKDAMEQSVVTSPMTGIIKTCGSPDTGGDDSGDSDTVVDDDVDDFEATSSGYDDTSENSEEANAFITIIAEGDYKVRGITDEMNIHNFTAGTAVVLRSRTDESVTWGGSVSKVNMEPKSDANDEYMDYGESASSYNFYVSPENTDGMILGQHLFIELDYGQGNTVSGVQLPSYFIINEEEAHYVWKRGEEGNIIKAAITLGEYNEDADTYEVTEGLTLDDYIAYPDDSIQEGDPTTTNYEDVMDVDDNDSEDEEFELEDEDVDYDESDDVIDLDESDGQDDQSFVDPVDGDSQGAAGEMINEGGDTGAEEMIKDPGESIDNPADVNVEE